MRAIKRKWCLGYFKLSILYALIYIFHFSIALANADLGLPRTSHCAFSYNESIYIFGGESDAMMITFNYSKWNTEAPTINALSNFTNITKCGMTRSSEKAILFDNNMVQVLDISTLHTVNMSYQGSQNAIDAFTTNKSVIRNPAIVGFDDYFMIYGGEQGNQTLQSTYILDARINNVGVWYELSNNSNNGSFIGNPPPPSVNTTLIATSRWILHFRSVKITPVNYTIYVDLFDPFNFNWLGTPITAFNTSTDAVNAALLSSDIILITPAWKIKSNVSGETNGFWIMNVSTWSPTAKVQWQEIGNSSYHPVSGNSVSVIRDLAIFYGGDNASQQLLFFNTTSNSFESDPTWYTPNPSSSNRNLLAILLGSLLGGLGFLILLFLLVLFCYKRKRKSRKNEFQSRSYEENYAKERMIPNEGPSHFQRSNSVASRYLLSPIKSVLPLFKENEVEAAEEEEPQQQNEMTTTTRQPTSRFREHFDMASFTNLKKPDDQGQSSSN